MFTGIFSIISMTDGAFHKLIQEQLTRIKNCFLFALLNTAFWTHWFVNKHTLLGMRMFLGQRLFFLPYMEIFFDCVYFNLKSLYNCMLYCVLNFFYFFFMFCLLCSQLKFIKNKSSVFANITQVSQVVARLHQTCTAGPKNSPSSLHIAFRWHFKRQ